MRTVSIYEVPQQMFEVSEICAKLADDIAEKYGTSSSAPPLSGMNMAYLSIIQAFELLDYYYHKWANLGSVYTGNDSERIRAENTQRVSLIQKSTFIFTMSAFEANAKIALELSGCPMKFTRKTIYFSEIMRRSYEIGLINDVDRDLWHFATQLRNCIVHNNGVADRDMSIEIGNGFILEMNKGKMTQSSPRKTTLLVSAILFAYSRWCDRFLEGVFRC